MGTLKKVKETNVLHLFLSADEICTQLWRRTKDLIKSITNIESLKTQTIKVKNIWKSNLITLEKTCSILKIAVMLVFSEGHKYYPQDECFYKL